MLKSLEQFPLREIRICFEILRSNLFSSYCVLFRVLRLCVCVTVAGWDMVTIEVRQKEHNCTSLLRLAFLKYLGHTKGLAYARIRKPLSSRRRLRRRIDFYLLAQRKRYSLIRQASEAGNVNVIIINTTFELFCWKGSLNCTLPFCRNYGSSADMATSKVASFFTWKYVEKKQVLCKSFGKGCFVD